MTAPPPSYDRELEWNEPPSASERRYARWTVVRATAAPADRWLPLARIGQADLYLAPPGSERDAPALFAEPVLAEKRGRRKGGDYVGVDGQVRRPGFAPGEPVAGAPAPARVAAPVAAAAAADAAADRAAVRVAVIDVAFGNLGALHGLGSDGAAVDGPFRVGLPEPGAGPPLPLSALSQAPGHGTAMAGILLHEVPGVRLGLFEIPSVAGAARPYLAPTDLAAALAAAVESWRADVVLVAMSDAAWGTPRHLRDVLREAARAGRGGRGAAIFCSVGDPSRNHVRKHDSAALGADDLASQPWVTAVAACDRRGRWYRVYTEYGAGGGATYNRFGPSLGLAASGEPRRFGERIAADDSSQASALAAAAAACVLRENPALTAVELRALLSLTAAVPPDVDGGRGLAAGAHDGRDRSGHSLKLGYGVVDARAACLAAADPVCLALLATREVPDVAPGGDGAVGESAGAGTPARAMAEAWAAAIRREAARPGGALAREYAGVAGRLSRLYLHALPLQEALSWLARHMRALCAAAGTAAGAGAWWSGEQDHGALVERIRHAAETAGDSLSPADADADAQAWTRRLLQALGDDDGGGDVLGAGGARADGVFAFLATAFAPVRRAPRSEDESHTLPERSAEDLGQADDDRRRGRT